MATHTVPSGLAANAPAVETTHTLLSELFGPAERREFAVELWDGSTQRPGNADSARFTLVLRWPGALRRMLLPPTQLSLAEGYLRDDFDVLGDLEAATALADDITARLRSPARLTRLIRLLRTLPADDVSTSPASESVETRLTGLRHSVARDRTAVRSHYDVGNDFYALWLDRRMVYSCGYFRDETDDLDTAQAAKLDHICRKLRLRPGERLLDIGCGWGALVMHAAERYGAEAVGITLSQPQAELARERIAAAGLDGRCRIEVRDYREFPAGTRFDKIASVGMVEHVGRANLPTYFEQAFRLLEPGGLFLNHGIVHKPLTDLAHRLAAPLRRIARQRSFIDRYVFPDGELMPLGEIVSRAEQAGFEARDVESLREHYAITLRHWVRRLEERHAEAARLAGERTYRAWRLYMSGSARGFATGRLNVAQSLLSKPGPDGRSSVPLTRTGLYA